MGEKEFLLYLDEAQENRYRYWHNAERGSIVEFRLQYEALIGRQWRSVVRYDTAHGSPHRDLIHPDGSETKNWYSGYPNNEILSIAQRDIITNWRRYRANYEMELRR